MGGKALKNAQTTRLGKDQYHKVAQRVEEEIRSRLNTDLVRVIPAYRNKQDFGDLDVLVSSTALHNGGPNFLENLAKDVFHCTDTFRNHNVFSFDFRESPNQVEPGFQVDVIAIKESCFDFALKYFAFNDLGNLIGRVSHKMGLKFGHNGLWYVFRDGDYKFREILLSEDFDFSLEVLGFDVDRYRQGFDDLTDIFEFVGSSKYFNPDIYLLENRNNVSRTRDRKRKTYMEFLKWCENTKGIKRYSFPEDKREWLPYAFFHFPEFEHAYQETVQWLEEERTVKQRFNGELVMQWTGKTGKELGSVMKAFREEFASKEEMNRYLLDNEQDVVRQRILNMDNT